MLDHTFFEAKNNSDKYIVLLHGFGGNNRVWKHQIPVLTEKYNVLAICLPGHHENEHTNITLSQIEPTLAVIAKEIIETCDNYSIREKRAGWLGVSLGTVFVKYIEAYYPEYVEFGILVGAMATVNALFTKITKLFSKIGNKLPFKLVYSIFSYVIMPGKKSKESRSIFKKCAIALNKTEFHLWMIVFNQAFAFSKKFAQLKSNIDNIYIIGSNDSVFKDGAVAEMEHSRNKLIVMKKCGHVCNIDQKQKFNSIIMQLIENKFLHPKKDGECGCIAVI